MPFSNFLWDDPRILCGEHIFYRSTSILFADKTMKHLMLLEKLKIEYFEYINLY